MKRKSSIGWVATMFAFGVLAVSLSAGLFFVGGKHRASRIEAEKAKQERTLAVRELKRATGNLDTSSFELDSQDGNDMDNQDINAQTDNQTRNEARNKTHNQTDNQQVNQFYYYAGYSDSFGQIQMP